METPSALKTVFAILTTVATCAMAAGGEPPAAREILQSMLARLPGEPVSVSGAVTVRKRHGIVERKLRFEMSLRWGAAPPVAVYTIRDAFGTEIEQLTVIRTPGQPAGYEYACGSPLRPAGIPDLGAPVQETDFSWFDMSLSFLWWTDGTVAGREIVKGRPCFVVDAKPPPGEIVPYAMMRLWIDEEIRMMLQAEAYGADNRPVRRLWVKSVRKVNDRWMIKDMDVESYPPVHRTKLTVDETGEEQL